MKFEDIAVGLRQIFGALYALDQTAARKELRKLLVTEDDRCPFCGSKEVIVVQHNVAAWASMCEDCNAEGPCGKTHADAMALWRRRGV